MSRPDPVKFKIATAFLECYSRPWANKWHQWLAWALIRAARRGCPSIYE